MVREPAIPGQRNRPVARAHAGGGLAALLLPRKQLVQPAIHRRPSHRRPPHAGAGRRRLAGRHRDARRLPRAPPPMMCRRPAQKGAALLTAMVIVTLIVSLAASMIWQQWRLIRVEAAERARVQAG